MSDQRNVSAENWFQRNPKKTLVVVTLVFILGIVFASEKFLEFNNRRHGIYLEAERRYVRLKEYRPGSRLLMTFPRNYLPYTDNVFTKKYPLDIDKDGFIMPSKIYDRPDKVIVFLGGSTTECMFVDPDHRYPYLVGKILGQETGEKINSYNGGMSGNNTLNAIDILINKVIPLHPQVVVYMEDINDLSTLLYEGTYWNKHTARSPLETQNRWKLVGKLLKEIFIPNLNNAYRDLKQNLFRHHGDEFANARGKKLKVDQARLVHEFAMNLQTLVGICQAHEIVPVLMTQENRITDHPDPVVLAYITRNSKSSGISYPEFKKLYDAFNDTIRKVGQKDHLMVIDLAREVPPSKKYLYDLVHMNDAGSELAAKIIAGQLKPLLVSSKQRAARVSK
jgi:lysophospholipase L1-like esterase